MANTSPFILFAIVLMLLISIFGVFINMYLFIKFCNKVGKNSGFQKLCIFKTIPNVIVCTVFLFWSVPLTVSPLEYSQVPLKINEIVGQIAGFGAYISGPILQLFMAFNRFSSLYFPVLSRKVGDFPVTNIAVTVAFFIALVYTLLGLVRESCSFVFDPDTISWRPEFTDCASHMASMFFYSILTLSICSNSLNIITACKLLTEKTGGISKSDALKRRKKWLVLFFQSVLQDCLHAIDMVNCSFIYKLYDAVWFQFIFLSLSFLIIHSFDGLVMFFFHTDIQPAYFRKTIQACTTKTVLVHVSTTRLSFIE